VWAIIIRGSGAGAPMLRQGPRSRPCWPLSCCPATTILGPTPRSCSASVGRPAETGEKGPGAAANRRREARPRRLAGGCRVRDRRQTRRPAVALWRASRKATGLETIDMDGAQVAVADYRPDWWPSNTWLLIPRTCLTAVRSRRIRGPGSAGACAPASAPCPELTEADTSYGYSFILTNLRCVHTEHGSRGGALVQASHKHRNIFRDSKNGAALRSAQWASPRQYRWMWGALLAASMAGWLHQLTAPEHATGHLSGWGVRDGKAMIATLRHRLITIPPGSSPCKTTDPAPASRSRPDHRNLHPTPHTPRMSLTTSPTQDLDTANPARHPGHHHAHNPPKQPTQRSTNWWRSTNALLTDSGLDEAAHKNLIACAFEQTSSVPS
jgi:hypothetical protein